MVYNKKNRKYNLDRNLNKKVVAIVKKQFRPELKQATTTTSTFAPGSTGTAVLAPWGIAQGDTAETRDGNAIQIKHMDMRLRITLHASAVSSQVRLLLVRNKQQVADTNPTWTQMFEDHSLVTNFLEARNTKFQVLFDRTYVISSDKPCAMVHYSKYMNYNVKFNGALSTDIEKGGCYLMAISNEVTNTPTVQYKTRVRYYDC